MTKKDRLPGILLALAGAAGLLLTARMAFSFPLRITIFIGVLSLALLIAGLVVFLGSFRQDGRGFAEDGGLRPPEGEPRTPSARPKKSGSLDEIYAAETGGRICPRCETIVPAGQGSCPVCGCPLPRQ